MWGDRHNPEVVFGDMRFETITVTDRSHGNVSGTRTLVIEPDVQLDFRNLPYPDNAFNLVVFDPPHLERAGGKSWLAAKYGKLGDNWRDDLRKGFAECFRVLKKDGVLVFKWNETQVSVKEVLQARASASAVWPFVRPKGPDSLAGIYEGITIHYLNEMERRTPICKQ